MAASRRLFHLPRLEVQNLILMYVKIFVSNEIKSKARLILSLLCVLLEGVRIWVEQPEMVLWEGECFTKDAQSLNFFSLPRNFKECPAVSGYV